MTYAYLQSAGSGWRSQAACRGCDPDVFFPLKGDGATLAKATCSRCPVAAECLEYALENEELQGWWGGKSPEARRRLRSERKRRIARCGTISGYTRHWKRGEPSCAACRVAKAEEMARYRAGTKVEFLPAATTDGLRRLQRESA